MEEVMSKFAPGERSGYHFGRSDEEVRPTFDLIRAGKDAAVEVDARETA